MIDSTNPRILADQIRELWKKIKSITGLPDYSETEVNTGQKWIDGKDIYLKCYNIAETLSSGDIDTIEIDNVVNCFNRVNYTSAEEIALQVPNIQGLYTSNAYIRVSYNENDGKLQYTAGGAFIGANLIVIFYFTKPDPVPENREPDQDPEPEPKTKKTTRKKSL